MADEEVEGAAGAAAEGAAGETAVVETKEQETPKMYDEKYVSELRDEAAKYRVKAKESTAFFEGIPEEDQEIWKSAIQNFAKDPKAAAEDLKQFVDAVMTQQEEDGITKGDPEFITKADLENAIKSEREAAETALILKEIEAEARTLGYNPNSEDEFESLEYSDLLKIAMATPGNDLKKAHEKLQARNQKVIDAYLESKKTDAGKSPKVPVAGGQAPSNASDETPKTLDDVMERAKARVEALNQN